MQFSGDTQHHLRQQRWVSSLSWPSLPSTTWCSSKTDFHFQSIFRCPAAGELHNQRSSNSVKSRWLCDRLTSFINPIPWNHVLPCEPFCLSTCQMLLAVVTHLATISVCFSTLVASPVAVLQLHTFWWLRYVTMVGSHGLR